MKIVSLLLTAALAACKPDSAAKPAAGSATAPVTTERRDRGVAPSLPASGETGSAETAPEPPKRPWLDKDGDGVVSPEERDAAREERAKRMRDRFDANHDGKLTPDELAAAGSGHRGPHFDDPKALDTNDDGEISPAELQEGLRDLRVRRRVRGMNGSDD